MTASFLFYFFLFLEGLVLGFEHVLSCLLGRQSILNYDPSVFAFSLLESHTFASVHNPPTSTFWTAAITGMLHQSGIFQIDWFTDTINQVNAKDDFAGGGVPLKATGSTDSISFFKIIHKVDNKHSGSHFSFSNT